MPASNRSIFFATGNAGKVLEAKIILAPFGIRVIAFRGKGEEIQADTSAEVASYSAEQASRRYQRTLIVEDAGLFVDSLGGFPGPFSSYVFDTIGTDGLLKLLEGTRSRKASFKSAVAYCEPDGEPMVFEGRVKGLISGSPVGSNGFGFDPIFVPSGGSKSMGELTVQEKCTISHRGEAMRKFAVWYSSRRP